MIKHILKIIWAQRRMNGWIFAELLLVICAVWWMTDRFWVDMRIYNSPMGYDITNTWLFKLEKLHSQSVKYVADEEFANPGRDDLEQLVRQIKLSPEVEETAISFFAHPYSSSSSFASINAVAGDTSVTKNRHFQIRYVTPSYFDVYKMKDIKGEPIGPMTISSGTVVVPTFNLAQLIFKSTDIKGIQLQERQQIAAVTSSYRGNEFEKPQESFFNVLNGTKLDEFIRSKGAEKMELTVRMKNKISKEEMENLLKNMGDRLTVNNLNVYSVTPISEYRDQILKAPKDALGKNVAMTIFLLINVLFGIIGTFWLRTQYRQGEMGIRTAIGATRYNNKSYIFSEGLILLCLTIPFTLAFAFNLIFNDTLDTYRLPYTFGRFMITYGITYLLLAGMICLGIWFPVIKNTRISPAEALHYE